MVVNHNMASICESRQLRYNVKKMEVSSKKLATGYKIIGANDDAAGLQISETMRHQTRGLNKASRNSQDGISMLQTADAALQETQDVLGRMVELTTQAANDTHTDADRRSIQDEIDQLNQEVDRIAYTTNFNQQYILAEGTPQAAPGYYRIQSGALNGQSIDIQFVNASKESLGVDKVDVSSHQKASESITMVQDAIDSSFQALSEHNTELADKIIKGDRDVDNMERKIETHCLMLMLKQQPVASDLRHISTALKVVTDLERMGDQAADIADLSLRLEAADYGLVSKHLPAMVANVKTMVKDAIRAFIERDTETAETFEQRDDLIDAFFERVKREVIEFLKKDGDKSDVAVDVLMVAKYLERIADHAVNVCEWTEFSDTGAVGNVMIL